MRWIMLQGADEQGRGRMRSRRRLRSYRNGWTPRTRSMLSCTPGASRASAAWHPRSSPPATPGLCPPHFQ